MLRVNNQLQIRENRIAPPGNIREHRLRLFWRVAQRQQVLVEMQTGHFHRRTAIWIEKMTIATTIATTNAIENVNPPR